MSHSQKNPNMTCISFIRFMLTAGIQIKNRGILIQTEPHILSISSSQCSNLIVFFHILQVLLAPTKDVVILMITLQGTITYPTLGKGRSSSKVPLDGTCDRSLEGTFMASIWSTFQRTKINLASNFGSFGFFW